MPPFDLRNLGSPFVSITKCERGSMTGLQESSGGAGEAHKEICHLGVSLLGKGTTFGSAAVWWGKHKAPHTHGIESGPNPLRQHHGSA